MTELVRAAKRDLSSRSGSAPKGDLLAAIPALRAFAVSLSGNADRADDLVQETLLKAWENMSSFAPGSNLRAWLFTILRNTFYSQYRKRRREAEGANSAGGALSTPPEQIAHLDFADFRKALHQLPPDQREALILIGASGYSYEEAATICDCKVGTIKSRVNCARARLVALLSLDPSEDLNTDRRWRAAIDAAPSPGSWNE